MEDDSVFPIPSDALDIVSYLGEGIMLGCGSYLSTREGKSWEKVRNMIRGEEGTNGNDGDDSGEKQNPEVLGGIPLSPILFAPAYLQTATTVGETTSYGGMGCSGTSILSPMCCFICIGISLMTIFAPVTTAVSHPVVIPSVPVNSGFSAFSVFGTTG